MSELYEAEAREVLKAQYEDTGEPVKALEDIKEEEAEQKLLNQGQALELMTLQPGWKLLENWIEAQVDNFKEAIVFEEDFERLVHHQESIKAYRSCVNWVRMGIAEAKKMHEDNSTPTDNL